VELSTIVAASMEPANPAFLVFTANSTYVGPLKCVELHALCGCE